MKKIIVVFFVSILLFFQCGCAILFSGPVTQCQRTKPVKGEPTRQIRAGALILDVIFGWYILGAPVIIDFVTCAIYKPCESGTTAANTNEDVKQTTRNIQQPTPDTPAYRGSGDPLKGLNVSKSTSINGNYYAFIIGIDKYSGQWAPLSNAARDAKTLEKMLREKYRTDYFYTLYDAQATRAEILRTFETIVGSVKEEDNLLIYFSGHGEFKKSLNKGYWVPSDAKTNAVSDLISNNDIQTFLASIKSKHTLLISDACFSGDIFRGNTISIPFEESDKYYMQVYNLPSRQALTSGGVEPVMDGGKDGHSVFTYYLLKNLENNTNKYFDIGQLYNNLKVPVVNNSDQTPHLDPIKNTGDEGGQFIFIKK